MVIGAVIAGVAAIAGTAVNIGMSVKASKEAEAQRKKQEKGLSGQRLASDVMRMKTEDVAGQGGLSAGQYNRSLMQNDVFATQAQGLVNKIESQSVFGDAFRNQSYAKLALSEVGSYTKKTAQGLQDLDTETAIRNAGLAMEGASRLAKTEADILAQETAFQEAEIARKTKIVENISKGIASTASLIGAGVKYKSMKAAQDSFKTGGSGLIAGLKESDQSAFAPSTLVDEPVINASGRATTSSLGGFDAWDASRPTVKALPASTEYSRLINTSNVDAWWEQEGWAVEPWILGE